ncbi:hypothetical protein H6P81_001355 [Aristolochia fimbriata]|uniref:Uncharacterized protein n=1 Tax=Aristolochia fimbriata TaxID=158543 RepID=A0AAV7F6S2_ARIFI|nr:hypothetical protein H6P81_001355 [Aristolochia fimbriata]
MDFDALPTGEGMDYGLWKQQARLQSPVSKKSVVADAAMLSHRRDSRPPLLTVDEKEMRSDLSLRMQQRE